MPDNEAGAFFNITPDVLKKLDSFDEKLEKIEKHAHTAADALKNGFGSVVVDTSKLESAIASLASKISSIGSKGNPFEGVSKGAGDTEKKTTSMNESLSRTADLLNRIGDKKIGQGSFSEWNIAELKESISDLKKFVENTQTISKQQQQTAVNAMRYMKMELDYQRQTDEQRVQSAEKTAQRKEAADRRAAKAAEQLARQQEIAQRTTPQGALDYSRNAKYLRDQVTAINYLKQARLSLNTTDANYRQTLEQINQAIAKHNQALQQAGVQSQQLATRHRNLMDTAGQLSRQLALVFSVSQIEGYISKLANVRGEFELQQRSLQAILQNKTQADQIFNKTVQLAVKSPFQIKELVSYTKQLAAYRIESDKLYDTTKRLADVSAGLGVDMQRLILAYGQVKAAAYLRGTEVRQFTEAGINLYGELQRYFEEMKGEAYTTAQIVDMISKRKVTFEDIENIFKRLTDSGGLFYNMQEIQAETLQGKIANLKDSIDVMLNAIGKDNEGVLKGSIDAVKYLIDNWEILAEILKGVAAAFVIMKIESMKTSKSLIDMAIKMNIVSAGSSKALKLTELLRLGFLKMGATLKALGATFMSNIWLVALAALAKGVIEMIGNYNEYNKSLEENTKRYNENMQPVNALIAKYNELAEAAENAKKSQEKNFDTVKNRKEREQAVVQLAEKFREFNIDKQVGDVTKLDDKQLTEVFDNLKKEYKELQDYIRGFANAYTEVNNRTTWNPLNWQDRIEGDAKDLQDAADEMTQYSIRVSQMLDVIGSKYDTLSPRLREYYNEVKNGPDTSKNESEVEWLERTYNALVNIIKGSKEVNKEFLSNRFSLFDISGSLQNFHSQRDEFFREVDRIRTEFENMGLKDPVLLSIALDQQAIQLEWTDLQKNLARQRLELPLIPKLKGDDKEEETEVDPKLQRDILAERISLIKELNKEYEKLNKVMGRDKAAKTVMERYASQLKDVQMPKNIIGEAFLPNKENTAKALQELAKIITDFRKKIGAQKDANVLFDEKDADDFKKQLDKTKDNIESMFNGLDLHKKLKDAGLSEAEVQQLFPGLAKTLDDVQKGIEAEYQKKFPKGEYLIADTDANKQYLADLNKLNQQRIKDSQDLVIELTKNYKSQLTDRLQLDRWYYEERAKIQRAKLTDEQKTLYESNLTSQYNKKSDENTWKQFQNSDMYISMFENIEGASTRMLTAMRDKLMSLRENLKDLPADQLKAIINQQEKIDEMIAKKNPFIGLTSGVKEYIQFLKERKELEEENIRANNAVDYYTSQSNEQSKIVEQKRQEYNAAVATYGILSKETKQLLIQFETEKSKLDIILKQLTAEKKISKETAEQIRNGQNLGDTLKNKIGESGRIFSEFSSALPQIASDLENVFGTMSDGTKDTINRTAEAAGGIAQIATGIAQGPVGYLQAAMGLAKTVSALFGSDDARLQRQIEEHEKKIKKLEREYDKLKESIDNVWDITKLQEYGNELDENINKQIVSLNAMIAAERDKKDTDWDKINEWQEQIEDLRDTLADSANDMIAELGGVGSDENFKTLAENFASAWLEAFQETGDGLSGLQDSFKEFVQNYVKQQLMLLGANKYLKDLFEEFDEIIATKTPMEQEERERYFELQDQITKLRNTANNSVVKSVAKKANAAADEIENSEEYKRLQKAYTDFLKPEEIDVEKLEKWNEKAKDRLTGLDEFWEGIVSKLDFLELDSSKSELSSLTQSIQGVTETTAEALKELLNSIRWFVSQQTTDITAIRNLLEARYSLESQAETNPMLIELKAQTGYLEIISDRIDRVFAPNSNSRGAGLRVFISD
jgi:chromosome segregation ATPase